jgi:hypothetical protein
MRKPKTAPKFFGQGRLVGYLVSSVPYCLACIRGSTLRYTDIRQADEIRIGQVELDEECSACGKDLSK